MSFVSIELSSSQLRSSIISDLVNESSRSYRYSVVFTHSSFPVPLYPADFSELTNAMKKASLEIVQGGGIVRGIHNHGIRNLPHRFRAKYPDKEGNRYYSKGRFISIYYDSNPATMRQVEQVLKLDENLLRNTHLKARSILDYVNIEREERNPYVRLVRQNQEKERRAMHHRNETVEQVIDDMRIDDV